MLNNSLIGMSKFMFVSHVVVYSNDKMMMINDDYLIYE